jgi:predicted NUDIX family phosphoesterase
MIIETILCIKTQLLTEQFQQKGFIPAECVNLNSFILPEHLWFIPRPIAERCEDFRQIIPYVILRHNNLTGIYQRSPKGNEKRLHGFHSIGFGGHVRLSDVILKNNELDVHETLNKSVYRELSEEVKHSPIEKREIIGMIFDDSDSVGRVHIGLVEIWTLSGAMIESSEYAIDGCKWVPDNELKLYTESMETWSRLCIENIL